jgi:hypothetical protein
MRAYSEDLPKKTVATRECGTTEESPSRSTVRRELLRS